MPAVETKLDLKSLRHEEFCLPRPGEEKPRVEGFVAYIDDAQMGRSRPSAFVTRCLECGAAVYRPISN
jgi:hypothetical protein